LLTAALLDLLVLAVYRRRAFDGDSLQSGEDLVIAFRTLSAAVKPVLVPLVAACIWAGVAHGEPTKVTGSSSEQHHAISPAQISRALERTFLDPRYAWRVRAPRKEEPGGLEGFLRGIGRLANRFWRAVRSLIERVVDWIRDLFGGGNRVGRGEGGQAGWLSTNGLLLLLLAVVLIVLLFFLRRGKRKAGSVAAQPLAAAIEEKDEELAPDLLPSAGWKERARERLARGDLRGAARAFYLASLALLATRGAITLARFKSNREYLRELERRERDRADLARAFTEGITVFERVWYGAHPATPEGVEILARSLDILESGPIVAALPPAVPGIP
jgi:hypothetical protein